MTPQKDPKQLYIERGKELTEARKKELSAGDLVFIESPAQLSDVQLTALDLYARGFNVIPLKPNQKHGYLLRPFFTARLHHCGDLCKHKGRENIAELFAGRRNIGVMTGRTSGNLLAIDCDTHASYAVIGKELTARKIPFWAVIGKRGGAYFLRILEGEAATEEKSRLFADVQIWGNRRLIVIPPSIHPSGLVYQWATPEPRFSLSPYETIPAVSVLALDWLGVRLQREARAQWEEPDLYGLPEWTAVLSRNNRREFATSPAREGDRNRVLTSFLSDMRGNDLDYSLAESMALDFAARTGLEKRAAVATLKSIYKRTNLQPARIGSSLRIWQRAELFTKVFDWRGEFGRGALNAQAVFMALVKRARMEGRESFRAAVREVAELANVNKETAAKWLNVLQPDFIKWTNPLEKDARRYKFAYRIFSITETRTLQLQGVDTVRDSVIVEQPKSEAEQDVFAKLGRVAWQVWKYLQQTTAPTIAAISRALHLPYTSVSEAVRLLQHDSYSLIGRGGDGHFYAKARTEASMQYLAALIYDGDSPSRRRKESHRIERERNVNRAVRKVIQNSGEE